MITARNHVQMSILLTLQFLVACSYSTKSDVGLYRERQFEDMNCSSAITDICAVGNDWTEYEFIKLMSLIKSSTDKQIDFDRVISVKKTRKAKLPNEITYSVDVAYIKLQDATCESWIGRIESFDVTMLKYENFVIIEHDATSLIEPSLCRPT